MVYPLTALWHEHHLVFSFPYFCHFSHCPLIQKVLCVIFLEKLCFSVVSWSSFCHQVFSPLISGRSSFLPFPDAVNSSLSPHSFLLWITFVFSWLKLFAYDLQQSYICFFFFFFTFYKLSPITASRYHHLTFFLIWFISSSSAHLFWPLSVTEANSAHTLCCTVRCS